MTPYAGRHEKIAVHDALGPFREYSLRPRDPSSAAREVALVQQRKREPERASRSALPVAAAEERLMRASQDIFAVGVSPSEVGRVREPFEILTLQRRFTIGR